jgi:hypothetical protein
VFTGKKAAVIGYTNLGFDECIHFLVHREQQITIPLWLGRNINRGQQQGSKLDGLLPKSKIYFCHRHR